MNFPVAESVQMTTVRALPRTRLRICVRSVGHFDDDRASYALRRLAVYDVFVGVANVLLLGSSDEEAGSG